MGADFAGVHLSGGNSFLGIQQDWLERTTMSGSVPFN
jgi:hypothetical protein